jgi:hypothetical protein
MSSPAGWAPVPIMAETAGVRVETLVLRNGERLARQGTPWQQLLVLLAGALSLERSDCADADFQVATVMLAIPPGVDFRLTAHETPTRLVLIGDGA